MKSVILCFGLVTFVAAQHFHHIHRRHGIKPQQQQLPQTTQPPQSPQKLQTPKAAQLPFINRRHHHQHYIRLPFPHHIRRPFPINMRPHFPHHMHRHGINGPQIPLHARHHHHHHRRELAAITRPALQGVFNPIARGAGKGIYGAAAGTQRTADLLGAAFRRFLKTFGGIVANAQRGAGIAVANAAPAIQNTIGAIQKNQGPVGDVVRIAGGK